jgi:hypothetical protein
LVIVPLENEDLWYANNEEYNEWNEGDKALIYTRLMVTQGLNGMISEDGNIEVLIDIVRSR